MRCNIPILWGAKIDKWKNQVAAAWLHRTTAQLEILKDNKSSSVFTLFWNSLELNTNTVKVNCYLSASSIPVTSQEKRQRRWLLFKSRKLFLKQHLNCRKNPQQDILTPNLINGTRRKMSRVRFTCANHSVCKSHKKVSFHQNCKRREPYLFKVEDIWMFPSKIR